MATRVFEWVSVAAVICATVAILVPRSARYCASPHPSPDVNDHSVATHSLGRSPGTFVTNHGQWPGAFRYRARFGAMTAFLEERGWVLSLVESVPVTAQREPQSRMRCRNERARGAAVRMRFLGAGVPDLIPCERRPGAHNYFVGSDPGRWRTGVPQHASVTYRELHPGVDVEVYGKDGLLEYDLSLQPGADLAAIAVEVEGALGLRLALDGALVIETAVGSLRQARPATFATDANGTRREIACEYELRGANTFGFVARDWNGDDWLLVDPGLAYSTFVGGMDLDWASVLSVDLTGTITFVGASWSSNYPTTPGAWDTVLDGSYDVTVSRLDPSRPSAQQLLFSTFVGGSGGEDATAVAVDPAGVITVAGWTDSSDYPTTLGAWDRTFALGEAFVTRLDPSRVGVQQLVYSTFLGGSDDDSASALALDSRGVVTVTGSTWSADYPTTAGAWGTAHQGGIDSFLTRLDPSRPSAQQLVYSTLVGGPRDDWANGVAVDALGVVTIAGQTSSANYPTTPSAWDRTHNGVEDVFVSRFDPSQPQAQQLVYSTFLGGDDYELAFGVAVDVHGVVTLGGLAWSLNFPTTSGAWSTTHNGGFSDAFVARLDPSRPPAQQLVYSTYVGGSGGEWASALAVDPAGVVTIVGSTRSANYPTTPGAWDTTFNGGASDQDAFVTRLDPFRPQAEQLLYSTFLGGLRVDYGFGIAIGTLGEATIVGSTESSVFFPTTLGAFDQFPNGGIDAFVTRFDMLPTGTRRFGTSSAGCNGGLAIGVTSMPRIGNATFALTCSNAPPLSVGVAAVTGSCLPAPVRVLGIDLWLDPSALLLVALQSDGRGTADMPLPLPQSSRFMGVRFHGQFVWFSPSTPAPCPPLGFSATAAIEVTVHP